tara:strand:- start:541 stop:852 length:312 start_codon:yes stop_codon:yes gene_type:complete
MPKQRDMEQSKSLVKACQSRMQIAFELQIKLAEVQSYLETENQRKLLLRIPHYDASLNDLRKIQARIRKWRSKLELIERQEQLKIDKQLITIQEAKNEQTTER